MREPLILVHGELETTVRVSECYCLLINEDFSTMELILRSFFLFLERNYDPREMRHQGLVVFAGGPLADSWLAFDFAGPLPVGVVFFPSFLFV